MPQTDCLLCGATAHRHPSEIDGLGGRRYGRRHCAVCGSYHVENGIAFKTLSEQARVAMKSKLAAHRNGDLEVGLRMKKRTAGVEVFTVNLRNGREPGIDSV